MSETAAASPQDTFHEFIARSIARPGTSHEIDAGGVKLHYLEWAGPPGAPALLLLHGFLGHAHWWDYVAPWLAEDHRVIAPDFSGMGDSGRRASYSQEQYVDEIGAILRAARITPCTVIGHSFGGRLALFACREFANAILRCIVVDSRLITPADPMRGFGEWRAKKRYATQEEIVARFRLQPEEPAPAAAMAHLAKHSVRRERDGWTWKFDDEVSRMFHGTAGEVDETALLAELTLPVDIIRGEQSKVVTDARAQRMADSLPGARRPIVIPMAYHHIPIGEPLALLATLRALLIRQ